jgi:hypothetical protein
VERPQGEGREGARVNFTILDVDQRGAEWFAARAGKLTSSCVDVIFMQGRTKGSESITKRDLRIRLALEHLSKRTLDGDTYRSADMQYGTDREPDARLAYEAHTGQLVREAGFLLHNELRTGCSLDGYIGDFEGIVEFKCPKSATHIAYLRDPAVPEDYLPQLRHQLWITGAQWADFVSFDDRLPEHLQLCIRRYVPTAVELTAHELAVRTFLTDVEREEEALMGAVAV